MGKVGSKLKTVITRPAKNYNLESRAFKEISKDKPTQAPTYPSLEKVMREIKNDPDLLNKGRLTAEEIKNLSQVYVTSTGDNPILKTKQQLPVDRGTHDEYVFGFPEPFKIPPGKLSIRQLLSLLSKHAADPKTNNVQALATEFKIDVKTAGHLIEYFRTFRVYVDPDAKGIALKEAREFAGIPEIPKLVNPYETIDKAKAKKGDDK